MSTATVSGAARSRPLLNFVLHLLEMTLAMMVGMLLFGALVGVIASASGSTLDVVRTGQPELFALGMATSMSVTMVGWMRRRGHSRRASGEAAAAMFVPVFLLIACYWAGAVSADSVCPIACMLMIPAMAGAMLVRLDHYTNGRAHTV
jgi:hypothetical protein